MKVRTCKPDCITTTIYCKLRWSFDGFDGWQRAVCGTFEKYIEPLAHSTVSIVYVFIYKVFVNSAERHSFKRKALMLWKISKDII